MDPEGELYLRAIHEQARARAGLPPLHDVGAPASEDEASDEEAQPQGREEQPQGQEGQPQGQEEGLESQEERLERQEEQPPPPVRKRPAAVAQGGRGAAPKRLRRNLPPHERAWLFSAFDIHDPTGSCVSADDLRAILTAGQTADPPTLSRSVTAHDVRSVQRSWRGEKERARLARVG